MCAFVELSDRVTVMHHDFVEGTCVIVTGDSMTMVIDAGAYPGHSRSLNEHLSSRGLACDVLALTHGHGDHVAGVLGIEARGVVSHPAALERALMAVRAIATWSDRNPMRSPSSSAIDSDLRSFPNILIWARWSWR